MPQDQHEINETLNFLSSIADSLERLSSPAAIFEPNVFLDGNKWCAMYGACIQDGITGFGATPEEAIQDFNREWISAKCPVPKDGHDSFPYEKRQLKRREDASVKAAGQAASEH